MKKLLDYEDIVHIRLVSNPEVDPYGKKVLFLVTRMNLDKDRYESNIWLYDVERKSYEAITQGPFDKCPKWAPDGERFAFLSKRLLKEEEKGHELWIGKINGGEPRHLVTFPLGINSFDWSPKGDLLLVVAPEGEIEEDVKHIEDIPIWFNGIGFTYNISVHLYIVDAKSGEKVKVTEGKVSVRVAKWSPSGDRIAYLVVKDRTKPYLVDLYVYDLKEDRHISIVEGYTAWDLDWSPDGEFIAFLGHNRPRGFTSHNRIWVVEASGGEPKCLTCTLDRNTINTMNSDVRGPSCTSKIKWAGDNRIYFLVTDGGTVSLYRVSSENHLERIIGFREGIVDEFSLSWKAETIAFTYMDPLHPKELYIKSGKGIEKVTNFNEFYLSRIELSKPKHFKFKASDGIWIDGWILPPPHMKEDEKIPWVLYIHGGPKSAYGWSFIEEFHLLAAKGFAVVYINPRGSDGYSEEFADIRCRYGERDYKDLMEAVDYVLKEYKFLDPTRIGVTGGSYGGFMTNWIITHTDRFKAAVTQRSISDWISMYGTTDIGFYFVEDQICCKPWENPEKCLEKSPIRYVDNVKTPTLIIHSFEDYRCWIDQALILFTALKKKGVETKLVIFPKENHDLSRSGKPKHRIERLKAITEWMEKYLMKENKNQDI